MAISVRPYQLFRVPLLFRIKVKACLPANPKVNKKGFVILESL